MFEPHPHGLLMQWEHEARLEADEVEREESEQRAAVEEFRDAAHAWFWKEWKDG